ncbi:hypothetical protein DYB28_008154 [Aphanomyces astaci]|uniref:Ankyrin repeat domain containing protein n=1 Tax=Aphanomyces astaci TaxID=112090 RepID=A0A9X8DKQ1_APHAT|nr:hypothetical protein DYB28_008154 [Aphanomyces astaci]
MAAHILRFHPLHSRDLGAIVFGFQRGFPREFLSIVSVLRAHIRSRRLYTSLTAWTATVPPSLESWLTHVDIVTFKRLFDLDASLFCHAMDDLACVGRRDLLAFLYRAGGTIHCSPAALDCAASAGHLKCVQFLTDTQSAAAMTEAMDQAAAHGFDSIVRYLHQHRPEGCTPRALDRAARAGHVSVVKYLVDHVRTCCCLSTALDIAAASGHLEIVHWLHPRTPRYRSTAAVDGAAAAGDLAMVELLLTRRHEGASAAAVEAAVALGRMDLLTRLLLETAVDVGCIAVVVAVERRHVEAVTLLTPRVLDWRPVMHAAVARGTCLHVVATTVLGCHVLLHDEPVATAVGVAALYVAALSQKHVMLQLLAAMGHANMWVEQAWHQAKMANDRAVMAHLCPLRRWWCRARSILF